MRFLIVIIFLITVIQPQAWEKMLSEFIRDPYGTVVEGDLVKVELQNNIPFNEVAFDSFLVELAGRIASISFPFKTILVKAKGEEKTYFHATLYLSDVNLLMENKISQPEFLRRSEIEMIETLESLQNKTKIARQKGEHSYAIEVLKKWLKLEPNSELALSLFGNAYRDEGQYWEAIAVYKKLLTLNPGPLSGSRETTIFVFHNLGYVYEKVGAFDDSINAYLKAIEMDAQNPQLMQQVAQVYQKNGERTLALEWVSKAKKLTNGKNADLWIIEGNIHRDTKNYSKAREAYVKAQTLAPQDHQILFNLILIDLDTEQYTEAKKKYETLKEQAPELTNSLKGVYLFEEGMSFP